MEQNDLKIQWEVPYDDVDGNDIMHAISTIMKGMTFSESSIYSSMAGYLNEYADDIYEVNEKSDN